MDEKLGFLNEAEGQIQLLEERIADEYEDRPSRPVLDAEIERKMWGLYIPNAPEEVQSAINNGREAFYSFETYIHYGRLNREEYIDTIENGAEVIENYDDAVDAHIEHLGTSEILDPDTLINQALNPKGIIDEDKVYEIAEIDEEDREGIQRNRLQLRTNLRGINLDKRVENHVVSADEIVRADYRVIIASIADLMNQELLKQKEKIDVEMPGPPLDYSKSF